MRSINETSSKVTRHRARMRAEGFRLIQLWVADTRSADFAAEVQRQCRDLKSDPEEAEVLRFTEQAASQIEGWE